MTEWSERRAGDLMSSPLITVPSGATLREAASTLSEHRISGALVVDENGNPAGVVSMFDIVTYLAGLDRPAEEPGGFYRYSYPAFGEGGEGWESGWEEVEVNAIRTAPVTEAMTPELISVDEKTPLAEVAKTMWKQHIHRVFVTREGRPEGVLTTMDVLGCLEAKEVRP